MTVPFAALPFIWTLLWVLLFFVPAAVFLIGFRRAMGPGRLLAQRQRMLSDPGTPPGRVLRMPSEWGYRHWMVSITGNLAVAGVIGSLIVGPLLYEAWRGFGFPGSCVEVAVLRRLQGASGVRQMRFTLDCQSLPWLFLLPVMGGIALMKLRGLARRMGTSLRRQGQGALAVIGCAALTAAAAGWAMGLVNAVQSAWMQWPDGAIGEVLAWGLPCVGMVFASFWLWRRVPRLILAAGSLPAAQARVFD